MLDQKKIPEVASPVGGQDFSDVLRRTANMFDQKKIPKVMPPVTRGWPRFYRCLKKNPSILDKKMIGSDATRGRSHI